MSNLFDSHQARTFQTAGRFFGYDAAWTPGDGSPAQEARVLFKDPAERDDFMKEAAVEQYPINPEMEWYKGDLPGLYDRVDERHHEVVTISIAGVDVEYDVLSAAPAHDGRTYKGKLQIKK